MDKLSEEENKKMGELSEDFQKFADPTIGYEFLHPEERAHLYFPSAIEQVTGEDKKTFRVFYEGNVKMNAFEKSNIENFIIQFEQMNNNEEGKELILNNRQYWTEMNILRFLQACKWDFKKTIQNMVEHTQWRLQTFPICLNDSLLTPIKQGIMYIHGRDHRYRPIIVLNPSLLDLKQLNLDDFLSSVIFFQEVIVNNMFLPGQVENWVVLINFNFMGLFTFPIKKFLKLINVLQSNYRARLHETYCVNASASVTIPWQAIKLFLDESTISKVKFVNKLPSQELMSICNPSQLEKKFGGNAPDVTSYEWPPQIIPGEVLLESEKEDEIFISKSEYQVRYKEKQLEKYKVHQNLIN